MSAKEKKCFGRSSYGANAAIVQEKTARGLIEIMATIEQAQ